MMKKYLTRFLLAGTVAATVSAPSMAQTPADVSADVGTFDPITLGESINLDPCGTFLTQAANGGAQTTLGSICDINSGAVGKVGFYYLISSGTTTHALVYGSYFEGLNNTIRDSIVNPSGGSRSRPTGGNPTVIMNSPQSLATGAGTLFSTAGTYVISLVAAIKSTGSFSLNGGTYTGAGDKGLTVSGSGIDVNGTSVGNFDGITIGNLGLVNSSNPATGDGFRNVSLSQTTIVVNNESIAIPEPSSLAVLLGGLLFGWRRHRQKLAG